jgi:ubiquinone/menaquinone biosynthesis C-methylase UbiE
MDKNIPIETSYNLEQIFTNEEGWIFYNSAFKNWKIIHENLIGESVLDIGCASGIALGMHKLFKPKINAEGFEGNSEAKPLWEERKLNVSIGDIYALPFLDNHFDTVYSSHVLEHLTDPKKAIEESIRVAKKRVIHSVPSGNVDDKNHGTPHLHYFNRINFKSLFDEKYYSKIILLNVEDVHMSSLILVLDK